MTRRVALLVSLIGVGLTSGCVVEGPPPPPAYVTYYQPYPGYYYGPGPYVSGSVSFYGRRH